MWRLVATPCSIMAMQYKSPEEELHCQRGHKMTRDKAEPSSSSRSWREDEPCLSFVFNMNYSSSSSMAMCDVGLFSFAFPSLAPSTPLLLDRHQEFSFPFSSHYPTFEEMFTHTNDHYVYWLHQITSPWKCYRTTAGTLHYLSISNIPSYSTLYPSSSSPLQQCLTILLFRSGRVPLHNKVHLKYPWSQQFCTYRNRICSSRLKYYYSFITSQKKEILDSHVII